MMRGFCWTHLSQYIVCRKLWRSLGHLDSFGSFLWRQEIVWAFALRRKNSIFILEVLMATHIIGFKISRIGCTRDFRISKGEDLEG